MSDQVSTQRTLGAFATDYQRLTFVIMQLLGRVITIVPVRVVAVYGAGTLTSCPTVDVQPLLDQRTGDDVGVSHVTVFGVPAWRLQSGTVAVVVDPNQGDVGLMLVAYRDTSNLRAADKASPGSLQGGSKTYQTGSAAQFDWGSGFYLGGWLNGAASQYIQLTSSLCKIVAPSINLNGLTIDSSGNLSTSGNITTTGGNVTAGSIDLKTHVHTGVTTGSGSTGPPTG
jgi:phage baseplate assembly protein gpV